MVAWIAWIFVTLYVSVSSYFRAFVFLGKTELWPRSFQSQIHNSGTEISWEWTCPGNEIDQDWVCLGTEMSRDWNEPGLNLPWEWNGPELRKSQDWNKPGLKRAATAATEFVLGLKLYGTEFSWDWNELGLNSPWEWVFGEWIFWDWKGPGISLRDWIFRDWNGGTKTYHNPNYQLRGLVKNHQLRNFTR